MNTATIPTIRDKTRHQTYTIEDIGTHLVCHVAVPWQHPWRDAPPDLEAHRLEWFGEDERLGLAVGTALRRGATEEDARRECDRIAGVLLAAEGRDIHCPRCRGWGFERVVGSDGESEWDTCTECERRAYCRDAHVRALTDELLRRFHDMAEHEGEWDTCSLANAAMSGDENARREVADLCAGVDGWGGGLGWTDDGTHPCAVAYEAGLRADHAEREDTGR